MDGSKTGNLKGTCPTMCPAGEAMFREKERLLHPFEVATGIGHNKVPQVDKSKAVKEFTRSAAGKGPCKPEDIRSPPVLVVTVEYLLREVATRSDVPWMEVYGFISNRLRAVRQDLVIQDSYDSDAVSILERAVRFYLYAGYHLCEEEVGAFDASINHTHLQECLKQLLRLYDDVGNVQPQQPGKTQQEARLFTKNRSEFESYYILYNLGEMSALRHFLHLPAELRSTKLLNVAWLLSKCYMERNFVRLFRIVAQDLSALQSCALHYHISRIWKSSLRTCCAAFSNKLCKYPVARYCRLHCIDDEAQMARVAQDHGCPCTDGYLTFQRPSWKENGEIPATHLSVIDYKIRMKSLGQLLLDG